MPLTIGRNRIIENRVTIWDFGNYCIVVKLNTKTNTYIKRFSISFNTAK